MQLELSVYRSNVSSALKPNADTRHAQCFHRTRTGVTGAALHDLYRGSNVSVMITNPLYEGSSGDLSTQGSDHPAAGGACGYGPVSVEHHTTCRAPPEGEPSLTTAKPATAKPATAKPTTAKSATAKPTTAKPTTAKPATAKPTTAKPATAKPTTAKPTPSSFVKLFSFLWPQC